MDGLFFPSSCGWVDDGVGDSFLPSYVQRGGSALLPRAGAAVAGSLASTVHGPFPSSSVVLRADAEAKAAAASRIHSLKERRRRERINGHLSTLRRMVPTANKMDKASLLASVIQEIRVLETKAAHVNGGSIVPLSVNRVSVEREQSNEQTNNNTLIKASIYCDDRPDLFADIIEALHGLRLRALNANTVSLGGRVQNCFVLSRASSDHGRVCLSSLMDTMKQELGRVARIDEEGSTHVSSKRRRFFQPHYSDVPSYVPWHKSFY